MKSKTWPTSVFVTLLGFALSLLCGCGKHNEAGVTFITLPASAGRVWFLPCSFVALTHECS